MNTTTKPLMRAIEDNELMLISGGHDEDREWEEEAEAALAELNDQDGGSGNGGFFGGGTVALGPAVGFTSGGGNTTGRVGIGVGYQVDLGYAGNATTLQDQVNQDGLVLCLGVCADLSADFFGDDFFIRGSGGVGLFYTENIGTRTR